MEAQTPIRCMSATAAFATQEKKLSRGYDALTSGEAKWALAVVPLSSPMPRACRRREDDRPPLHPERMVKRSQDLEKAFSTRANSIGFWRRRGGDPLAHVWDGAAPMEIDPMRGAQSAKARGFSG